jgi:isopenicillin N synthase-like dioxygenase
MLRTEDGKKDAIEVYTLSQDDIMGNVPARANPEPIESHRNDCQAFFKHAYAAVAIILNHLESHLDLQPGTLAAQCSLDKPSATAVRMLLSPAQQVHEDRRINFGGHTDIGIITLLFNVAGGLQILPAGAKNEGSNWRYIRPQEGCALINIGDTLTEWTGGLLRSSLHRVVSPPGGQAQFPRRSLAYLVRAERNATVRRLKGGGVIPALSEGEEEDARNVDAWAAWRAQQIMNGELKPQSRGGN